MSATGRPICRRCRITACNAKRIDLPGTDGKVRIKLLYFIQLAKLTGKDEEKVELPAAVSTVETLLAWLAGRRPGWDEAFAPERVQVTVNRHFSEPFTRIEHGDEVAIVPRATQA